MLCTDGKSQIMRFANSSFYPWRGMCQQLQVSCNGTSHEILPVKPAVLCGYARYDCGSFSGRVGMPLDLKDQLGLAASVEPGQHRCSRELVGNISASALGSGIVAADIFRM